MVICNLEGSLELECTCESLNHGVLNPRKIKNILKWEPIGIALNKPNSDFFFFIAPRPITAHRGRVVKGKGEVRSCTLAVFSHINVMHVAGSEIWEKCRAPTMKPRG
jgi:hypothetical protein